MNELHQALGSKEKELQKSTARCSELADRVPSLSQDVHRLKMRCDRAGEVRSRAIEKAIDRVKKHYESTETKRVKHPNGRIEDWVRDLVVELVALDGVPTAKVPQVIDRVWRSLAQGSENDVKQSISDRSVRRIMIEAYIKAFLYAAKLFKAAPCQYWNDYLIARGLTFDDKAWTASGDGTSRKGANISTHFATFPPVPFRQDVEGITPGVPSRQFLASIREVNHKTSTQLENWFALCDDIATISNNSPSGSENPITVNEIFQKVTGYSADHAADQKKLAKEIYERKREAVISARGAKAIMTRPAEEVQEVLTEKFMEVLRSIGGWESWGKLSTEDQIRWMEDLIKDVERHFGELDLAELPEFERRIELLFAWSGCSMHKDLNVFKAGAVRLAEFWKEADLNGPVKLLSREQEEALASKDGTDDDVDTARGGAVKLASLVGALVNNKEEGKGCFEEFQTYTHNHLGNVITFPDTSNVRYQCYGDAAAEIIRHPDLYTDFINQHGMMKKGAAGPNHMESNILKGLTDPMTMTEMAVLTLYHESVSKPYARQVRGLANEHKNALDLGPLHSDLEAHCSAIAENPAILLGVDVSHKTGAFYGIPWDQTVIDHILSIRNQLPHLDRALVAFFKGACQKWPAFTEEFGPDSESSKMTAEEKALSFRSPTNDHCEGACAMSKCWSRRAPTMTTHQKNARLQVQLNGPGLLEFSHCLREEDRAFTRQKARELDAAKLPLKERNAQAVANRKAAEEEQKDAERRASRREDRKTEESKLLEGFKPILDLDQFRSFPATQPKNYILRQQLVWHRVVGGDKDLPAGLFTSMNKERMKELIIGALERWKKKAAEDETIVAGDGRLGSPTSRTEIDDRTDVDAVLLSDDSELELELIDDIGLNLNDAKHIKHSPPRSTCGRVPIPECLNSSTPVSLIYDFGCRWDPVNYSCSYDCVFTTFAWMYFHATERWRTTWAGKLPAAKALSHHFRTILERLGPNNQPAQQITALFSRGRDAFRDVLSRESPTMFQRHGHAYACLTDILHWLSRKQTSSQYFSFISSCGGRNCNIKVKTPAGAPFMLTPNTWTDIAHSENPPHHESLQEWIVGWFNRKGSLPSHSCPRCRVDYSQTRSFLQPPWIWFEVFVGQTHAVLPSFELTFSSHIYRLAAVIYGNSCHFVARLCTPSGTWWYYDGQLNGGRPVAVEPITREEDLFICGNGYIVNALVYCRTD